MRHIPRPSASMVVAMLALFVALGGTVYAASTISGKAVKRNSLPGNRIKRKTVTGSQLKNDTITGTQVNEATLGKVPSAATADVATTALSANPVAYAHVFGDGTVDSSDAFNITNANVLLANLGTYCLMGLPKVHVVLANVDSADRPGLAQTTVLPSSFTWCPANASAEIVTITPNNDASDFEEGFYVVVY